MNQISASVTDLEARKGVIDATSNEELLMTKAGELRETFMGYQETVKGMVDAIHASKVSDAEDTTGDRYAAIEAKLGELAAEGVDVTALRIELESAQTHIADSKTLRASGDYTGAVRQLKGAYSIFRSVSQAVNNL